MRGLRAVFAVAVVAGVSWFASPAHAACHAFDFTKTSFEPTEGGTVTVTIRRDAALADSSVQVRSVNGSATGGSDFVAVNRRVMFTGDEVEKSIQVLTQQDSTDEPNETFKIEFVPNSGQGCEVNDNFTYGPPATITIKDNDAAAATTAPTAAPTAAPTPAPTQGATPSPTPTGSPSPTPTGSESPSPTPSESPSASPVDVEEEDGGFPWLPVAAIGGFLAAAGGAVALMRMRTATPGG